jgi:hypothetical protein
MESKPNPTNGCQDNPFSAEEAVGTESNQIDAGDSSGVMFPELPIGSPERAEVFAELRKTFAEDWKEAELAVAEKRRAAKGDLYFVRVGRHLKIGHATNMASRMRSISCHAPTPPEIVGIIKGAGADEGEWHRRFSHLRSNREWFKITSELKRAVDNALAAAAGVERV